MSTNMWSKTHVIRIMFIVVEPHELLLVLKRKRNFRISILKIIIH